MTAEPPAAEPGEVLVGMRRFSADARAFDLIVMLEGTGTAGASAAEVQLELGWTRSQFEGALSTARTRLCPELDLTIPHPVPDDGWRYRLTGSWLEADGTPAIEAGTSFAISRIEGRLITILRDIRVAALHLDPQSIEGRKANFLRKHLSHIVSVLAEIAPNRVEEEDPE